MLKERSSKKVPKIPREEEVEVEDNEEELEEVEQMEIEENNQNIEQNEENEIDDNLDDDQNFENKIEASQINIDMKEVNLKIQSLLEKITNLTQSKEKDPLISRNAYMNELKHYLKIYYDYNDEMINLITNLFAPNEAVEFLEANNTERVMTIRTNTLKTKRRELAKSLIQRGVNLDPLAEWSKVGLKIYDSQVPVGATPEYLSGHYMLQSGSSFLPVLALAPGENERILDMSSAPGGKTTYISQLMKNTGILVANDIKKERLKSLYYNVHRLGCKNVIITNFDGRSIPNHMNEFDRVLLDAPCSGLGVISKDPSIKLNRTYRDIQDNSRLQKELLLAAIDACNYKLNSPGIIVYSTCSISVEENEWVVDYALKNRYVKLVDTELEIGEEGLTKYREKRFHPSLKLTKRIYPHIHNMDGFFVAKLKKFANGPKKRNAAEDEEKEEYSKMSQNEKVVEDEELSLDLNDDKEDDDVFTQKQGNNKPNNKKKKQEPNTINEFVDQTNESSNTNKDVKPELLNKKTKRNTKQIDNNNLQKNKFKKEEKKVQVNSNKNAEIILNEEKKEMKEVQTKKNKEKQTVITEEIKEVEKPKKKKKNNDQNTEVVAKMEEDEKLKEENKSKKKKKKNDINN